MLSDAADSQLSNVDGCIADDFAEDGDDVDEEDRFVEVNHRHFDAFMEQEPPGKRYPARMRGAYSTKRRAHLKLAVSRYANPEPIGQTLLFFQRIHNRCTYKSVFHLFRIAHFYRTDARGLLPAEAASRFGVVCRQRAGSRRDRWRREVRALVFEMGSSTDFGQARAS